jgi:hypothetical protein
MINGKVLGSEISEPKYRNLITKHGGVLPVVKELLGHIRQDVKSLQGTTLSRQALDQVKAGQTKPWPKMVGYMDFITDSRLEPFVRTYVGQTGDGCRRIMQNHAQAIMQGRNESLHYFILWLGNGSRTANFLQLWSFADNTPQDEWYHAKNDILELLFCIFFNSLPVQNITETSQDKAGSIVGGLNVMTPLNQHRPITESDKLRFLQAMTISLDPQVRL